jgi:TRAP transporter TAXI family solute receptor
MKSFAERHFRTRLYRAALRNAALGVALAGAIFAGTGSAFAQAQPINLTIGSFAQGSSWYVYAVNLGELLRNEFPSGSTIDTPPIAGGLGNPPLVSTGKAQLAFGMAVVGAWALDGKNAYKAPLANLRALVGGWDEYYLVPIARGVEANADLTGFFKTVRPKARVTLLQRGSIGAFGGIQLLEIAGADEKALSAQGGNYEFGSFDMVKNRFANSTGDVFVQVATIGHPSITEMAQNSPVTFLQPSKAVLDEMTKRYGWETRVLPKGTFPGQKEDVLLPATTTTLFASAEMPETQAYLIVKTICEKADKLRAAHKALATFDCQKNEVWSKSVNGLPLHPGAERYYRERGWLK